MRREIDNRQRQHFQRIFAVLTFWEREGAEFAAVFAHANAVDDVASVTGHRRIVNRIVDFLS